MAINVYPQPSSVGKPDNAKKILIGGYFTDSGYTATGSFPAGLYALTAFRLNDIDRKVGVTFPNNNVSYVASPGNLNYIYISNPETSISFYPYGGQSSSTVTYISGTSFFQLGGSTWLWHTPGTTNVSIASSVGMLYNSTDGGITWRAIHNRTNDGTYSSYQPAAIAYDPTKTNKYVAVRYGGSTNVVQWSNSTDGITWGTFSSLSGHTGFLMTKPKVLNGTYVFPHYYGVPTYYIAQSTNGSSWTYKTPNITNLQIVDLEYNPTNSTWIAVSNQTSGNGLGGIFTSTDLTTWTTRLSTSMPQTSYQAYASLIKHGSLFVASAAYSTVIQTSTDGITWRAVYSAEMFRNFFTNWNSGNYSTLGYANAYSYLNSNFIMGFNSSSLIAYSDSHNGLIPIAQSGISHGQTSVPTSFAFGNGTYIATFIGANAKISTSTNLTTWTNVNATNAPVTMYSSVYGDKFVIGGASGAIATSTDNGSTWTARTSNITQNIFGLAYTGTLTNKYVAVGPSGNIAYSTDALTWVSATTGTANLQDVIFAGGKYVAVGYSSTTGQSYISTNGNTWTTNSLTGIPALGKVVFFNNLYIAIQTRAVFSTVGGSDFTRTIYTSTDAITWTTRGIPSSYFSANHGFISIEAGANNVIAVTSDGLPVVSFNGTTWTAYNMYSWIAGRALASNGSRLFAATTSQQTNSGVNDPRWIYSDDNGDSWNVADYKVNINAITHNGVGSEFIGSVDQNYLYYSPNGQNWSTTVIPQLNISSYSERLSNSFTALNNGQKVIMVGGFASENGTAQTGYVYVSSNAGQTWQRINAGLAGFSGSRTSIFTITAGKSQIIGLPYYYNASNTTANNTFRYSTDGITWNSSTAFSFSTASIGYNLSGGIAYNPVTSTFVYPMTYTSGATQYLVFGQINENTLAHSLSTSFSPTGASSSFIAYGDSKFVGGGSHTASTTVTIYVSDAFGSNWVQRTMTSPLNSTPYGAAYGNGIWILCASNQYFTSTDAVTWTSRGTAAQSSVVNGARFIDGVFYVALGANNTFAISTDALTWTTITIQMPEVPTNQRTTSFVKGADGSTFIAASPDGSLYSNSQQAQAAIAYLYSVDFTTYS